MGLQLLLALLSLQVLLCCVWAQRGGYPNGDPFGAGVRYSNSRVAGTVSRRYPPGSNATQPPPRQRLSYTTPVPTTTTTDKEEEDEALWWATSSTTTTTEKPRRKYYRKKDRETLDDWRKRFSGTWVGPTSAPKRTSTLYTPIEEGSYYDRPSTSDAPAKLVATSQAPPFTWAPTHRPRHHHRRPEGERSRLTESTLPPPPTSTTPASADRYSPPHTLDPQKTPGSVKYHNSKPSGPVTHRRRTEHVTYVAGSYFPQGSSNRLSKPTSFLSRNSLEEDREREGTPPPQLIVYPTTYRSIRIRYFPGGQQQQPQQLQQRRQRPQEDSLHPFASSSGKHSYRN